MTQEVFNKAIDLKNKIEDLELTASFLKNKEVDALSRLSQFFRYQVDEKMISDFADACLVRTDELI